MLVVKYAFSGAKQYVLLTNTRMHNLPHASFKFFTIHVGVFYVVLSLPHNFRLSLDIYSANLDDFLKEILIPVKKVQLK